MNSVTVPSAAKQRIRGPNLAILVKSYANIPGSLSTRVDGVPMVEALSKADGGNAVIASNMRLSKALGGSTSEVGWEGLRILGALSAWTGTMTGYAKPGVEFGATIECEDTIYGHIKNTVVKYIFPVPQEYQKIKNGILVVEHPDYSLVPDGPNRFVVNAAKVKLLEKFPAKNGWYFPDEVHGIPVGSPLMQDQLLQVPCWCSQEDSLKVRSLTRSEASGRVGLVVRGSDEGDFTRMRHTVRHVYLSFAPSMHLGVVIEAV